VGPPTKLCVIKERCAAGDSVNDRTISHIDCRLIKEQERSYNFKMRREAHFYMEVGWMNI